MSASTSRQPSDDETPPHKVQKRISFLPSFDGSDSEESEIPPLKKVSRTSTPKHKEKTGMCPDESMGDVSSLMEGDLTAREVSPVPSTSTANASAMGDVSSLKDTRNSDKGVLSELKILSKKVSDLDQTVKNTDIKIDRILERLAETNTSKTVKASAAPEVPAQVQSKHDEEIKLADEKEERKTERVKRTKLKFYRKERERKKRDREIRDTEAVSVYANTMGNENVPGLRDTPFYVSKEEFNEAVNASPMLPLFEIKGTIMNKSFKSNPSVRTQESIEQVHGEHNDLSSCGKCAVSKCVPDELQSS
ncbi:unnamed protein product [Mytilus edulis]|uniref:Uncharacterized protein n=1 Tax=Mytilus edulis TaxID=6550 RepID=A0A8S3RTF3_MYTED|nr:unnamed protein product [Mytilus edulis]